MASSAVFLDSDLLDSCSERQRDEVEALRSIFSTDFNDVRTEKSNQPYMYEITLEPTKGPSGKKAHAKVVLCVQYTSDYPKSVPIIDVKNNKGLSLEQIKILKKNLLKKAQEFVGEEMVLKLTYFIQDYLEAYNFEKPSSVYDEMLKNQQKQEADKATNEKKRKDIILMLEQKKNKEVEDEVKQRFEAIRKKQKEDHSSDEESDSCCQASSVEPAFSSSESQNPLNNRDTNIPAIKVDNPSKNEDDMKSSSDFFFRKPKSCRIKRDFEVIAHLGEGAFGYVIKVKNKLDDRIYAIKIINSKHNDKLFKNITTEVKLLSHFNHENIVRYYNSWIEEYGSSDDDDDDDNDDDDDDVEEDGAKSLEEFSYSLSDYIVFQGDDDDDDDAEDNFDADDDLEVDGCSAEKPGPKRYLFIQMEYCEKSTLKTCIEEDLYKETGRVWRLFRELLDALAHIHEQGIIHRDLKPGNIFLDSHDHIKIGDFGLATIRKPKPQPAANLPALQPGLLQNEDCLTSTLTTEIGTFLYMSPEMSSSSGHYDQQVDMYSLGIIFFEMCYTRMETKMERFKVLTNLRHPEILFPDNFEAKLVNQKQIIQELLNHEPKRRPTSKKLLQSCLLPPLEIEEAKIKDVLASAISNPKSKTYKYIVESFFNQKYDDVCDTMYDNDVFKPCHVRYSLLQQNIIDSITQIFCRHGAVRINTPLLMPRNKIHSAINPTFLDQNGQLVCLPDNHKVPLIRYVKRKNIINLKRYNIDRIFLGKSYGLHPKEFIKCSFDIITPTTGNFLPDSEIIYLIEEIINEFSGLKDRNFSIVMNHPCIIKALLMYCDISKENLEEIMLLLEKRGEKTKYIQEALERLGVSDQKKGLFMKMLKVEGKLDEIKFNLSFLTKFKGEIFANFKQGIKELTEILSHCELFEIKLPIRIKLGFLRHINQYSGVFFEVNSLSKKQTIDILAIGGRYDKLMSDYTVPLYTKQKDLNSSSCAVGISISLDQIVSMLNKENEDIKRCDFMVCAYPDKSSTKSLLKKVHSLWSKKKNAMLAYDTVQRLDKIEKQCKVEGIRNLIIIKDQNHSKEMTFDDNNKLRKKSFKIENVEQVCEKDTKSRNPFKITFCLIDRNTNKRSLTIKVQTELNSNLKWIPCNSARINVLVVDLPTTTVKELAARIDLTNKELFARSVSNIESAFKKSHRKYSQELYEKIQEIRFDDGSSNIILYTLVDDFFKII